MSTSSHCSVVAKPAFRPHPSQQYRPPVSNRRRCSHGFEISCDAGQDSERCIHQGRLQSRQMDSPFGGQCGDQRFVAIGGVGNSCWKTIPRCNGYPCGFMALIETVPASIRNASHSRSWSRNWYSAGAMITMGRGGSLMNAAGHDQRTRKSSPAQMASSIAPW